jgi:hypothetical protein
MTGIRANMTGIRADRTGIRADRRDIRAIKIRVVNFFIVIKITITVSSDEVK